MSNFFVNLPDELERFVSENIASGRYRDTSDVVQTALKVLRDSPILGYLQSEASAGFAELDLGQSRTVDPDQFMAEIDRAEGLLL